MSAVREGEQVPVQAQVRLKGDQLLVVSPVDMIEACFSVSSVRALRNARPGLGLAVLAPETSVPLWHAVTGLQEVIAYPESAGSRQIAGYLQDSSFRADSSLAWEASEASASVVKAGIAQRVGYDCKPLRRHLTDLCFGRPLHGPVGHRVRFYMDLVEQLGIDGYVESSFLTPPRPPRSAPFHIGLVPGSTLGDSYCWGVERFGQLGEQLLSQPEVEVSIIACPGGMTEATVLSRRLDKEIKDFSEGADAAAFLETLSRCSLVVSNDGLAPHLAAHLGVPTVAIFGPGDPVAMRPLGRQHRVLSQHVDCSPCSASTCPLKHHRCLEELPVARVYEAVDSLLGDRAQAGPEG